MPDIAQSTDSNQSNTRKRHLRNLLYSKPICAQAVFYNIKKEKKNEKKTKKKPTATTMTMHFLARDLSHTAIRETKAKLEILLRLDYWKILKLFTFPE